MINKLKLFGVAAGLVSLLACEPILKEEKKDYSNPYLNPNCVTLKGSPWCPEYECGKNYLIAFKEIAVITGNIITCFYREGYEEVCKDVEDSVEMSDEVAETFSDLVVDNRMLYEMEESLKNSKKNKK